MHLSPYAVALASLAFARIASAHTVLTNLYVDGVDQHDGTCIRMSNIMGRVNFPVVPITSDDVACGVHGQSGVARVCPAKAGSVLTAWFQSDPTGSSGTNTLDPSHKGTCAVYMKKVKSAIADGNAAGDGWFKIWAEDYDQSAGKWCTEKLIANNGYLSVNIPNDIEGGYYLVRTELVALHQANLQPPNPQFFVGCAQLYLTSGGTAVPKETVSIPGYVDLNNPAMSFDIYQTPLKLPYPTVGPPVYQSATKAAPTVDAGPQTEGLKPANCVLQAANWCGIEVPSYSTQDSCWTASNDCWSQNNECWKSAGAAGQPGCRIWQTKCETIQKNCKDGNYAGPPDAGKDITAPLRVMNLPSPSAAKSRRSIKHRMAHARRVRVRAQIYEDNE